MWGFESVRDVSTAEKVIKEGKERMAVILVWR